MDMDIDIDMGLMEDDYPQEDVVITDALPAVSKSWCFGSYYVCTEYKAAPVFPTATEQCAKRHLWNR